MSDINSALPIRTEGDVSEKVQVRILDASNDANKLKVNADGSIDVNIAEPVTVDSTDLDIRDLSASQDNVAISDGTDTLAINADGSLNAVVTATDLDIRDLDFAQDSVDVSGSSNVGVVATDLDIRDLDFAQDSVDVSGSSVSVSGSVTVSATDLDIRDLSHSQDSVKIGDGTDFLAVNSDGSLNVVISDSTPGTPVNSYNKATALAAAASSNHDYTVTALKTLNLNQVWGSASGKLKIEVQVETAVASGVFNTIFVSFNSTANPAVDIDIDNPPLVAAGVRVRVIRTNLDNQPQDVYSTIGGFEV